MNEVRCIHAHASVLTAAALRCRLAVSFTGCSCKMVRTVVIVFSYMYMSLFARTQIYRKSFIFITLLNINTKRWRSTDIWERQQQDTTACMTKLNVSLIRRRYKPLQLKLFGVLSRNTKTEMWTNANLNFISYGCQTRSLT